MNTKGNKHTAALAPPRPSPPGSRQSELLEFIRQYVARNGQAPRIVEMATSLRVSSPASVAWLLDGLERRGLIRREQRPQRNVRGVGACPYCGRGADT